MSQSTTITNSNLDIARQVIAKARTLFVAKLLPESNLQIEGDDLRFSFVSYPDEDPEVEECELTVRTEEHHGLLWLVVIPADVKENQITLPVMNMEEVHTWLTTIIEHWDA